ncbi:MAG TPA: hypothetical protein VE842_11155 [Pyrinomonadaceae bacterium]|jgi:hypothetical protein|nr:hypothetical protein [Pyrinomonadaceae bacterium]
MDFYTAIDGRIKGASELRRIGSFGGPEYYCEPLYRGDDGE